MVGDDDQSIYKFRGAEYRQDLRDFERGFSGCESSVKLEQNYRSTQNILDAANGVIANNAEQESEDALDGRTAEGEKIDFRAV